MTTFLVDQKMIQHEINKEMKDSYIDYAMSVIVSRALPDVKRRIKAGTQKDPLRYERTGSNS